MTAVKNLIIMKDTKMKLFEQIRNTADKAVVRTFSFCHLLANVGGSLFSRRYLLVSAVQFVLVYDD